MIQKSFSLSTFRWKSLLASWQQLDLLLLILSIGLTVFGGVMIRSTELAQDLSDSYFLQHWLIGGLGLAMVLTLARWRYDYLIQWHWVIYIITNLLLIAIKIPGVGVTVNGSTRWINVLGFNVQPSEFAKLGLIITMAALLHARPATTLPSIFRTLAITAVPWVLVFIQPDLGTSLVFGAISLGMLYWGKANPGWLILAVSPLFSILFYNLYLPVWLGWVVLMGIVAWFSLPLRFFGTFCAAIANVISGGLGGFVWGLLEDYQKKRLILFLNPEQEPLGGGYHLIQSRIAIGSGNLWGRGLNQGTQTQLDFIPEQHTDFIFSAVGEELGFVGCICLLIAFWLICLRLIMVAQGANENFGSLLAIGVLSMIAFQVIVNISMTIGLAPVTGIPLPWMSYGRSALITNFLAIGLVESVANQRRKQTF